MTVESFASATGYSASYIRRACGSGKLPCDMWNGVYEIPKSLVPIWRAKRNKSKRTKSENIHKSVTRYQNALDKYNEEHGTYYSYGQAVMLDVIK